MKQMILAFIGGIALMGAIVFGVTTRTEASDRERWEYTTVPGQPGVGTYNHLGDQGWELAAIACVETRGQCWYHFKRRK